MLPTPMLKAVSLLRLRFFTCITQSSIELQDIYFDTANTFIYQLPTPDNTDQFYCPDLGPSVSRVAPGKLMP